MNRSRIKVNAEEENMQHTSLGRTRLQVSKICLGTMNFGSYVPEEESFRIMSRALEAGVNFFDTANVYGGKAGKGATEKIVGNWLAENPSRRDDIVLATKVYGTMGSGPNDGGLSAYHIRQACNESLRRLQTDRIDLYQMHHVDRDAPWEEIWQAMEQLMQEGKILYVGSSNFAGWHIGLAQAAAQQRNFLGLVSEQSLYNLIERTAELEVLPACQHYGLGVIPWSPLSGGLLGGVLENRGNGRRDSDRIAERVENYRNQLEEYEDFCQELGAKPAEVALAWLIANPVVTAPIIGPRTLEQLNSALNAVEMELTDAVLSRLDAIFPGPGDAAPEAYAW